MYLDKKTSLLQEDEIDQDSSGSERFYGEGFQPSPDLKKKLCQIKQSYESLDVLLPRLHAQTVTQTYWVMMEESIIQYLKSLGLSMKTDPKQKERQFRKNKKGNTKFVLIGKTNFDSEDEDEELNIRDRNTSLDDRVRNVQKIRLFESPVDLGLGGNKFMIRKATSKISNSAQISIENHS